jgi:hypothetical protein
MFPYRVLVVVMFVNAQPQSYYELMSTDDDNDNDELSLFLSALWTKYSLLRDYREKYIFCCKMNAWELSACLICKSLFFCLVSVPRS